MARGHGIIINLSSGLPWIFQFNPQSVESSKKINYFQAPNVGGSSRKLFYTGSDNEEINVELQAINKQDSMGVTPDINFFRQLREPDAGITGIAGSFLGNENYPPPQVLFTFGTGNMVPLIYDVLDVNITASYMKGDEIGGVLGIPTVAKFNIRLSLDENTRLYKMNQIAKKVSAITGSVRSITNEVKGPGRKEQMRLV